MPLLSPIGGKTWCTIVSGKFSDTYDDNVNTSCAFKTGISCLSEWYWDNPVTVTAINFHTRNYNKDNNIYWIWGRSNGSWVEIWHKTLYLPSGIWYGHGMITPCPNCTGIRIAQHHETGASTPHIDEIKINYEEPEGKALITRVVAPSEFTPNVPFFVAVDVTNVGGDDNLFFRFINSDTGEILRDVAPSMIIKTGQIWSLNNEVLLTQTTDFHGHLEAGHIE